MNRSLKDTQQKALHINLDPSKYGTFAEIGAGQEVARWFFRAGGASGTIAKTMSAYDMTVSDAIYGPSDRYVSRQRLQMMLDYEYRLLLERLNPKRGANTRFFVFADTVTTRGHSRRDESHGWMGIRWQTVPQGPPSEIIIHVRMLDTENVQQQEALGIVGVNLIFGAFYMNEQPRELIALLVDNLTAARVEVDMIKFSGAAFEGLDNRLMSLQLVQQGLAQAAMFTASGEVVQASEVLYKKAILVERGRFRPVTRLNIDMLERAQAMFVQEAQVQGEEIVVLAEMTLKTLADDGGSIDHRDFLDRVDTLSALGKTVLISNYGEFYRLAGYFARYTKKMVGLAMGVPTLRELFEEKYYANLEGGILESFGRLFQNALKLYVHPFKDPKSGAVITAGGLQVAPHLRHLYSHLLENLFIEGIRDFDQRYLSIYAADVLDRIRASDPGFANMVPAEVAQLIQERKLFGWNSPS